MIPEDGLMMSHRPGEPSAGVEPQDDRGLTHSLIVDQTFAGKLIGNTTG